MHATDDEPRVLRTVPLVQETPEGLRWLRVGSLASGAPVYERDATLERLVMQPAPLTTEPAIRLFVGGHAGTVQGEREDLAGNRMFTAAHPPQAARNRAASEVNGVVDSGAFTDPWDRRLTPEAALDRQFAWEMKATRIWQADQPWRAAGFASYDLLIDEKWVAGRRYKERWDVKSAEAAVRETIAAARYFNAQRARIAPRTLVLGCQGVDDGQYLECVTEVLGVARSGDWLGLGGWCILGRQRRWMSTFWATLHRILPRIAQSPVKHVHIFGVLYLPALGGLLYLADRYGITVSTDSTAPVLACTWKNKKKSGARHPYWRDNVRWWGGYTCKLASKCILQTTAYE